MNKKRLIAGALILIALITSLLVGYKLGVEDGRINGEFNNCEANSNGVNLSNPPVCIDSAGSHTSKSTILGL